jgi:glutamate 5-kinase
MYTYDKLFGEYNHTVAQILLTADDIQDDNRSRHVKDTLERLLDWNALPIINENDAVAIDEIGVHTTIGENDTLSAIVAELVDADMLVLLSDIDGLYTEDPRKNPNATLIPTVEAITPQILALAGGTGTSMGSGGMATKLKAAGIAMSAGIDMIIANGEAPEALYALLEGKPIGTRFIGRTESK